MLQKMIPQELPLPVLVYSSVTGVFAFGHKRALTLRSTSALCDNRHKFHVLSAFAASSAFLLSENTAKLPRQSFLAFQLNLHGAIFPEKSAPGLNFSCL